MPFPSTAWAPEAYNYIRSNWPYMNRSIAAGQTRHFITHTCDQGPSSCEYAERTLTEGKIPAYYNPAAKDRVVGASRSGALHGPPAEAHVAAGHLQWNGRADGQSAGNKECLVCFDLEKDIQIMTAQNTCGPLCGYDREALRHWSLWSSKNEARYAELLVAPRENVLFYGGRIHAKRGPHDISGRAQILSHLGRPGYKIVNTMGDDPDKPLPVEVKRNYRSFAEEMSKADFCYSPLGQFEGDTDRYVPAVLFGCIPIMLTTTYVFGTVQVPMAMPLSERLDWSKFSVQISADQIFDLHNILGNITAAKRHRMRRTMSRIWRRFLYTSIYAPTQGPYMQEDGKDDAFDTLMEVFAHRLSLMPPLPVGDVQVP